MSAIDIHIKNVNDKLQQLLKKHNALQKENELLNKELLTLKEKETTQNKLLDEVNQKVSILKAASGHMSETDQKEFEKRIEKYIKEIDKCISILSE